ncbi:MAG TPA: octaprenyl diphosphate synthase [Acidiferrobacteraceae bacterium]|nr:octaprenyl diphosphate synthase [Acidiferrobacteraceae bacterium]HEX19892.1 octaprenyl diphosphate synthase [Acidiferrobacteraceae bacterium]
MLQKREKTTAVDPGSIYRLVAEDMAATDTEILARLQSEVVLINEIGRYIVNSGGKRMRPMIVLLSSRAFAYDGSRHIQLATIIEFIHTATLLHDDVVDASDIRRGEHTANAVWGNETAVLVGDFLYSRAFEMMVEVGSMRVMEILSRTTNIIAEGEVMQLLNCHNPETSEQQYINVIRNKTAKLFSAAAHLGAVIGDQDETIQTAMANYGMHLGTAFQLVDDVLDFSSSRKELGKNIGDDLAEGKPTLPLIYAMRQGTDVERQLIRQAIEDGGLKQIDAVLAAIESTGAMTYTAEKAGEEAELARQALAPVPESPFKQALSDLALYSVHRNH